MRRIFRGGLRACCIVLLLPGGLTLASAGVGRAATATPTATATASVTNSPTPTATGSSTATATTSPTVTSSPTTTATISPTPGDPVSPLLDRFEPNDDQATATPLTVGERYGKLTFAPADIDLFAVEVADDAAPRTIQIDTFVGYGIDTRLRLLRADGVLLAANDDVERDTRRSQITADLLRAGRYYVEVTNVAERPEYQTYALETAWLAQGTPTATKTAAPTETPVPTASPATAGPASSATPTPSPAPAWDTSENNYDFVHAADVAVAEVVDDLNFVCPDPTGDCIDNDFFRVTLKGGVCYHIATVNLRPGVDTNLILFGPDRDAVPPLTGNDDAAPGDFSSAVDYCVPPTWGSVTAYLLVGNAGNQPPPAPVAERTYALSIAATAPATPTPTRTTAPTAAPTAAALPAADPPSAAPARAATAAPAAPVPTAVAPVAPLAPPSAPPAGPSVAIPGVVVTELPSDSDLGGSRMAQVAAPLALRTCYDRNQNEFCDIDEGIAGLTVYVTNGATGQLLGQALTDERGIATLTVRADADAQLDISVPYFAASQTTPARAPQLVPVMIRTVAPIPALLP